MKSELTVSQNKRVGPNFKKFLGNLFSKIAMSSDMLNILINYTITGQFIMYSGNAKIYYRKTEGHVFTKHVQIEVTTENFFPVRCLSS
jgi:hypothetical protein